MVHGRVVEILPSLTQNKYNWQLLILKIPIVESINYYRDLFHAFYKTLLNIITLNIV